MPLTDKEMSSQSRRRWAPPVLEELTTDLRAIASNSNGTGDTKGSMHAPS